MPFVASGNRVCIIRVWRGYAKPRVVMHTSYMGGAGLTVVRVGSENGTKLESANVPEVWDEIQYRM